MFKKRIITVIMGITLALSVMGASGIVADSLGFEFTPQAEACGGHSSGGGC